MLRVGWFYVIRRYLDDIFTSSSVRDNVGGASNTKENKVRIDMNKILRVILRVYTDIGPHLRSKVINAC